MNMPTLATKGRLKLLIALCSMVAFLGAGWTWHQRRDDSDISRTGWSTVLVQRGDLTLPVSGAGIFVAKQQKLLTSPSAGTVEEIFAAPGTLASKGNVVLRLTNSRLAEQKSLAKVALEKADLDLKEAMLSERIDAMSESGKERALVLQLSVEQRERSAMLPLLERGIISRLEMSRAEARVAGLQAQLNDQRSKIALGHELSQSRIAIKAEVLKQAREAISVAQSDLDALTIRSSVDGPLQDLFVQLGQSVVQGEKLALVSSSNDLIATLKIPQNKAPTIAYGSNVNLFVQGKTVRGKVIRIDPKVREDSVLVDVAPSDALPTGVRAAQSVTGDIDGAAPSETMYVEQQGDIAPFKEKDLFLLGGNELHKHHAQFGAKAGKFVEVLSGLQPGDRVAVGLDHLLYAKASLTVVD